MEYAEATPALQLLMRRHIATVWETDIPGEFKIGIPKRGRGNPYELRKVTPEMLSAAQKQIDTGIPAVRSELDFPAPKHQRPIRPMRGQKRY